MLLSGNTDTPENDNGVGNVFGLFEASNTARKSKNSLPNAFVSCFVNFLSCVAFYSVAFAIAINFSFLVVLSRDISVASSGYLSSSHTSLLYLHLIFRFNNKAYFNSKISNY